MITQHIRLILIFSILTISIFGIIPLSTAQSDAIPDAFYPVHPNVDASLPIPIPISPENPSFLTNNQPTFEWSQDKNIAGISYHFEWTLNNPNFDSKISPIHNYGTSNTHLTLDYPLPDGTIFWRVLTVKGNSLSDVSVPSSISIIYMISSKNPSGDFIKIISNPVVAGAVGTAIGGLISFVPNYWIENKKQKQFKKNVRNFVKEELQAYYNFILAIREHGTENTNGDIRIIDSGMQTQIDQMMPNNRKFNPANYPSLTAETKSQVFDMDTLIILDESYRLLKNLQEVGASLEASLGGEYVFSGNSMRDLETSLTKAISRL